MIVSSWHIDSDGRVRQTWPAPKPEPRVQGCSRCGESGHNAATCASAAKVREVIARRRT